MMIILINKNYFEIIYIFALPTNTTEKKSWKFNILLPCIMITIRTHLLRQQINVALVSSRWRVE